MTISVCGYLWTLYSVPLIYVSVIVLVPCCFGYCIFVVFSVVRECDTFSFVFLTQDCFGYSGSLYLAMHYFSPFSFISSDKSSFLCSPNSSYTVLDNIIPKCCVPLLVNFTSILIVFAL